MNIEKKTTFAKCQTNNFHNIFLTVHLELILH